MSVALTDIDSACDPLQALIYRVDEHVEDVMKHLDEIFDTFDAIREVQRDLQQLQTDLVSGDPEVSPSARLVEGKVLGAPPVAELFATVVPIRGGENAY